MKTQKASAFELLLLCLSFVVFIGACDNNDDSDDNTSQSADDDNDDADDDDTTDDDASGDDDLPRILQKESQARIDEVTKTQRSYNNEVELLVNGVASVPVRDELIEKASETINIQALDIAPDDSGYSTAEKLVEKVAAGVEVNVILDWMSQVLFQGDMGPIEVMAEGGVNLVTYFPPGWDWDIFINKRIHEKLLIVDGREAVMGGLNIGDHYYHGGVSPDGWRDTDIRVTGKAVGELQRRFVDNWVEFNTMDDPAFLLENEERFFPFIEDTGETTVRYVTHTPRDNELYLFKMYQTVIPMAEDFVYLENPYFCMPRPLLDRVVETANNGVDIRILTNSKETNDLGEPMWYASLYHFQELLDAGVRIFVMTGYEYEMIHSKTASIDGVWSTVGSYNLDYRSAYTNSENTMNVHGAEFGEQVAEQLLLDMSEPYAVEITQEYMDALTEEDHRKMEFYHKLQGVL